MILCGREAPLAAWLCTPGWSGLFRSLAIEALPEAESVELLALSGISENRAHHINRFTRGHPLALNLAARAACGYRSSTRVRAFSGTTTIQLNLHKFAQRFAGRHK
jgi:hypothetical protein